MNCASGLCLKLDLDLSDIAKLNNIDGVNLTMTGNGYHNFCAPVSLVNIIWG